jgi:hypothetical protein
MKLEQLFENTQLPMTREQVEKILNDHFQSARNVESWNFKIDSQGGIHMNEMLNTDKFFNRLPLQLASVTYLIVGGLKFLDNLPLRVKDSLRFSTDLQDLSTASPVSFDPHASLMLRNCANLTSLKGIENFKVEGGKINRVSIRNCPNLAIDLFDYSKTVRQFHFRDEPPHNVKLVRATTMANMVAMYDFPNGVLVDIINKYRGRGRGRVAAALKMANELRAAELEHHVDWAQ